MANLPAIQEDALGFLERTHEAYGNSLRYRIALWTVYRFCHPEQVKWVLQDNQRNYSKDSIDYQVLKRVSGNGLIASQGDFWRQQRRLMQPIFHRRYIANLVAQMVQITDEMLDSWETDGEQLNVSQAITSLTLNIASQTLLSLDFATQGDDFQTSFGVVNRFFGEFSPVFLLAPWLPTPAIRAYDRALARLDEIVYGIIAERRKETAVSSDILTLLLQATDADTGQQMSDQQLRDELITLLIAGHETSANSLAWLVYLVAQHPQVEAQLVAEVEDVLQGRLPTINDLPKLEYTVQVIKETLRLYPPAWFISRTAVSADKLDGFDVDAGAFVSLSPYLLHRHADFWPDPARFDPTRFTPEQEKRRHRFAYIPFGNGPRKCIGADFAMTELTIIVAMLVQRYQLQLLPGQPLPNARARITLGMDSDLMMGISRRSK